MSVTFLGNRLAAYLVALTCLMIVQVHGQNTKQTPKLKPDRTAASSRLGHFAWMDGKWEKDPVALTEFRNRVHRIWSQDAVDFKEVESLYLQYIAAYRRNKNVLDLARILILESYFRRWHYRFGFDILEEMMRNPGLDTYEYARAAWCVLTMDEAASLASWKLVPLFLDRAATDPSIKICAIDFWGLKLPGEPPISIIPKFAEELLRDFPQRDEAVLGAALYGHAKYFERAGKKTENLKKVVEYGRRLVNHPQALPGIPKMTQRFIAKYEAELVRRTKKYD